MPAIATKNTLLRRLTPLYVAVFFQGFVLWYTIEKLFMRAIGFDDAGIGLMIASYSALMILAETPSGILADRWSRKGVLILASIALAASSLVGSLSRSEPGYILAMALWGIFFSLYSGTYDSVVYDTVLEEAGESSGYAYFYGRVKVVDSAALLMSALAGGLAAELAGLRAAYFATVPMAALSITALIKFREPRLHKAEVAAPLRQHLVQTFGSVLRKGRLAPVLVVLICMSALTYTLLEFSQLWLIALAAPVAFFGPAYGVLLATIGLGGLLAARMQLHKNAMLAATLLLMLASTAGLIFLRNTLLVVLCQVVLCSGLVAMTVVFNRLLHDGLESKVRAGASSAVNTLARMVIVPLALMFGIASREASIFGAAWLLLGLLIVGVASVLITVRLHRRLPLLEDANG